MRNNVTYRFISCIIKYYGELIFTFKSVSNDFKQKNLEFEDIEKLNMFHH